MFKGKHGHVSAGKVSESHMAEYKMNQSPDGGVNDMPPPFFPAYPSYPPPPEFYAAPAANSALDARPLAPHVIVDGTVVPLPRTTAAPAPAGRQRARRGPAGWLKRIFAPVLTFLALAWKFLLSLKLLFAFKFALTSLTFIASAVLYGWAFGSWRFGLGLVLLLLIHELGHVVVLRLKGVPASLPIFVPFLGAFVGMRQLPHNVADEAEIGIAGPIAGGIAAALCLPLYYHTQQGLFLSLFYIGCFLNLFNLAPISPLDGGRVVAALSPRLWIVGLLVLIGLLFWNFNIIVLLIILVAASTAWSRWREYRYASAASMEYYAVPLSFRVLIGLLYFGTAIALTIGMVTARSLMGI
jgi:Zn-dependent protease